MSKTVNYVALEITKTDVSVKFHQDGVRLPSCSEERKRCDEQPVQVNRAFHQVRLQKCSLVPDEKAYVRAVGHRAWYRFLVALAQAEAKRLDFKSVMT